MRLGVRQPSGAFLRKRFDRHNQSHRGAIHRLTKGCGKTESKPYKDDDNHQIKLSPVPRLIGLRFTRMKRQRYWTRIALVGSLFCIAFCIYYVKSHPLVFNESLWQHAHCMPQAASAFRLYAEENGRRFPYHTNGYGDALLMTTPERAWFYYLTGPGYNTSAFEDALSSNGNVDENRCGRVYVQGLSETNDARIAILFDKVAAPPDHCHFPQRLWRGYVREVLFVNGDWRTVPVAQWPDFVQQQMGFLMEAGFSKKHAQELYDEVK